MPSRGEGSSSRASTRGLTLPQTSQRKEKAEILGNMRTSRTHHAGFKASNGAPTLKIKTIDIEFDNTKTHLDTHGPIPVVSMPVLGSKDPVMHIGVPLKIEGPEHDKKDKKEPSAPVAEFEPYPQQHRRLCPLPRKDGQYYTYQDKTMEEYENEVEYTMDEEDWVWLEKSVNSTRKKKEKVSDVTFEACMDRLEKFSYRNNHEDALQVDDEAVCVICQDGDTEAGNAILFCDYCNIPVHQDCYGVVLIPEGQWLCRRCSVCADGRLVSGACKLCPSKGGAFKQTMDGEWMHVICAMWIPEVHFGNDQYLEPIMDVDKIPPARWKLKCYICGLNNAGACIQCSTKTCYAAYHATCARTANLYMRMSSIPESYCDAHSPNDWGATLVSTLPTTTGRPKVLISATLKKLLIESGVGVSEVAVNDAVPLVAVPTVPLKEMSAFLTAYKDKVHGKADFLKKVMPYWFLKRKSRSGVPLLRRLHTAVKGEDGDTLDVEVLDGGGNALKKRIQKLRIVLERLRILAEFTVRRERLKKELNNIQRSVVLKRICPLLSAHSQLLDSLRKLDTRGFFHYPVDVNEVDDYLEKISHPMDFATMGRKVENLEYCTLAQFRADFDLIIKNATTYNTKKSPYHKEALAVKRKAVPLFTALQDKLAHFPVHPHTGLLLPAGVEYHAESEDPRKSSLTAKSSETKIATHPAVTEIHPSKRESQPSPSSTDIRGNENTAKKHSTANPVHKSARDKSKTLLKHKSNSPTLSTSDELEGKVNSTSQDIHKPSANGAAKMTLGLDSVSTLTPASMSTETIATEIANEDERKKHSKHTPKTNTSRTNSRGNAESTLEETVSPTTTQPNPDASADQGQQTVDMDVDTTSHSKIDQHTVSAENRAGAEYAQSAQLEPRASPQSIQSTQIGLAGTKHSTADSVVSSPKATHTHPEGTAAHTTKTQVHAEENTGKGTRPDPSDKSDKADKSDKPDTALPDDHTVAKPPTHNLRHSSRPSSRTQSAQSILHPSDTHRDTPSNKRTRPKSETRGVTQSAVKRRKVQEEPQTTRKGRRTRSQPASPKKSPIAENESPNESERKTATAYSDYYAKTFSPLATRRQRSQHAPTSLDNDSDDIPLIAQIHENLDSQETVKVSRGGSTRSAGRGKKVASSRKPVVGTGKVGGHTDKDTGGDRKTVKGKRAQAQSKQSGSKRKPRDNPRGGSAINSTAEHSEADDSASPTSDDDDDVNHTSDAGSDFEPNLRLGEFTGVGGHVRTRGSTRSGVSGGKSTRTTSTEQPVGKRGTTGVRGGGVGRGRGRKSARTSGTNTAEPTPKRKGKR